LQSRHDPKKLLPIKAWEKELAGKLAEKQELYVGCDILKESFKSSEANNQTVLG
jgi:hypothetical protein